jgi:hypothetical protein
MFINNLQQLEEYLRSCVLRNQGNINEDELLPIESYVFYLSKLSYDKINQYTWLVRVDPHNLHEDLFMTFIAQNKSIIQVQLPKWVEQSTTTEFHSHLRSVADLAGVYSFWTAKNTALYVGVSVNLGSRIVQSYRERFEKYGKSIYLKTISGISYSDACVLEVYYINRLRPAFNSTGNAGDELTIDINYPVDWCDPILCNKPKP